MAAVDKARANLRDVYSPSQDTNLLRTAVNEYSGIAALEIGFGTGSIMGELAKRFQFVVGTELVLPRAVGESLRKCEALVADRASCFRDGVFDLVVFNPPYLPSESIGDLAVDGGDKGLEVPLLFLNEALRVVKETGKVLLVLSSESETEIFEEDCRKKNLQFRVIASKDLFYENLWVYEVTAS